MTSAKQGYEKRLKALKKERNSYDAHYKDIAAFMLPRVTRFLSDGVNNQSNKGNKRHQFVISNTALLASRTLSSGMVAGITSPARPWFSLSHANRELVKLPQVKFWLKDVQDTMRDVLSASNFYNVVQAVYKELGAFATGCMIALKDPDTVVRFYRFTVGEYYLANDERGRVDVFYREYQRTVRQLVNQFGKENCSPPVQRQYERGELEQWIDVVHLIEPNTDMVPGSKKVKDMAYRSVYFEKGSKGDGLLQTSGFPSFRVMAPRWELLDGDVYGGSCPGMDALGDTRQLYFQHRKKAKALDKQIDPPMVGPSSLKSQHVSLLPGELTYLDVAAGQQGFVPAYQINFDINGVMADMHETEQRISRAFYEDLFLMLAQSDRREITAREVDERHGEKMLMLGPVLERIQDEMLDPVIDAVFEICLDEGLFPPPPEELSDLELKVEYISILAQAQRAVETARIEQGMGFVANLATLDPSVIDKFNLDAAVDEYSDMLGLPPALIRGDEDVAQIRAQRAQQQQQQQQAEMLAQGAESAKTLGDTNVGPDNALGQIFGSIAAG